MVVCFAGAKFIANCFIISVPGASQIRQAMFKANCPHGLAKAKARSKSKDDKDSSSESYLPRTVRKFLGRTVGTIEIP